MTRAFTAVLNEKLQQTTWNIATLVPMLEAFLLDESPMYGQFRREILMDDLMDLVPKSQTNEGVAMGLALQFELGARLLREAMAKAKKAKAT